MELIHALRDVDIAPLGSYTIGYPDETFDAMMETIIMAKQHVGEGLSAASFFVIVPFPGTTLFDMAIRDNHLSLDFDLSSSEAKRESAFKSVVSVSGD